MKIDKIIELLERVEKKLNKKGLKGTYKIVGDRLVIETDKYDIKWSTTFKTNTLFFYNSLLGFINNVDYRIRKLKELEEGNSNEN